MTIGDSDYFGLTIPFDFFLLKHENLIFIFMILIKLSNNQSVEAMTSTCYLQGLF